MAKQKVTLTLDAELLKKVQLLVGARSLSAAVNATMEDLVAKLEQLAAVDRWLQDLEAKHGPIPTDATDWAAQVIDAWEQKTASKAG